MNATSEERARRARFFFAPTPPLFFFPAYSRAVARPARVRDDVTDVVHPRAEEDEPLEPEPEPAVHDGSVPPEVHVPLVLRGVEPAFRHAALHDVDALLSLRAADELAHPGHEHVHRGDGFVVVVQAHVERLDVLGVVVHDDRLLVHLLREVPLVLGGEVDAPLHRVHKLHALRHRLLQNLNRLRVRDAPEGVLRDVLDAREAFFVVHLAQKLQVRAVALQHVVQAVAHVILGALHVVLQVGKGELGLDHPELGEVARGVGVLRAERGAERVHGGHRARVRLHVELPGDGQERRLVEEIPGVIDLAVFVAEDAANLARRRLHLGELAFQLQHRVHRGLDRGLITTLRFRGVLHGLHRLASSLAFRALRRDRL
mmetsp:Transcript_11425/g.47912  ORF Transcript_11425/g.47912 Transcript_11425/m.47912 type:complete len:372 (+) Transcript_11425:50-1165(+)